MGSPAEFQKYVVEDTQETRDLMKKLKLIK